MLFLHPVYPVYGLLKASLDIQFGRDNGPAEAHQQCVDDPDLMYSVVRNALTPVELDAAEQLRKAVVEA